VCGRLHPQVLRRLSFFDQKVISLHQSRRCWVYRNIGTQLLETKNKAPSIGATESERNEKEIVRHKYIYTQGEASQIDVIWKSKTQRSLGTREQFRRKIDFQIEWERVSWTGWLLQGEIVEWGGEICRMVVRVLKVVVSERVRVEGE
jgi:hypothetical protein